MLGQTEFKQCIGGIARRSVGGSKYVVLGKATPARPWSYTDRLIVLKLVAILY